MSTKNKSVKKSKPSAADEMFGLDKFFAHGEEQEQMLTFHSYACLERFATGNADHADRQAMRIRLIAAVVLLEGFDYNPYAEAVINRAVELVTAYRPQSPRDLRKIDVGAMGTLRTAVIMVDELVKRSTYWQQVEAYKFAENGCLTGAADYFYELITVH